VRAKLKRGRRNYAMILLMARLGKRAPEVIAMRLDDIDWRAGELPVAESLVNSIRHDRVSEGRALFVTERAAYGPFKKSYRYRVEGEQADM
jgi:integrase/recombinase XerD